MMLRNDFHHTEVQINLRSTRRLSKYQVKRAWKALCGIKTCTCSGPAGERPVGQWFERVHVYLQHHPDGSATVEVL
jgi:hypothetical protein